MARQVTVNLFDVTSGARTPRLSDTIEAFEALQLDQRWRGDIRLDGVEWRNTDGARAAFLDFAKKREIGPGKLTDRRAIESIHMQRDENFGEETAALYVPSKKWLLVLNNQSGVGPNRMMGYFNAIDPGNVQHDYEANPKLDATAMSQLRRMEGVSSVEVTATLDALSASQREVGTALARAARPSGAQRISFALMANERYKKGRFLDTGMMKEFMRHLRSEGPGVTTLRVTGPDPDSEKDLVVDLIRHRLKRRYNENELDVDSRRFTIESRWRLLARAFRSWNNTL
ncbi:MAG TPA: DUF6731 family protein [Ramlibacter sp.]|nr:DUF6731 family protein [Ramlibacter sp.]